MLASDIACYGKIFVLSNRPFVSMHIRIHGMSTVCMHVFRHGFMYCTWCCSPIVECRGGFVQSATNDGEITVKVFLRSDVE